MDTGGWGREGKGLGVENDVAAAFLSHFAPSSPPCRELVEILGV